MFSFFVFIKTAFSRCRTSPPRVSVITLRQSSCRQPKIYNLFPFREVLIASALNYLPSEFLVTLFYLLENTKARTRVLKCRRTVNSTIRKYFSLAHSPKPPKNQMNPISKTQTTLHAIFLKIQIF